MNTQTMYEEIACKGPLRERSGCDFGGLGPWLIGPALVSVLRFEQEYSEWNLRVAFSDWQKRRPRGPGGR